jgi:hypothetical protein
MQNCATTESVPIAKIAHMTLRLADTPSSEMPRCSAKAEATMIAIKVKSVMIALIENT